MYFYFPRLVNGVAGVTSSQRWPTWGDKKSKEKGEHVWVRPVSSFLWAVYLRARVIGCCDECRRRMNGKICFAHSQKKKINEQKNTRKYARAAKTFSVVAAEESDWSKDVRGTWLQVETQIPSRDWWRPQRSNLESIGSKWWNCSFHSKRAHPATSLNQRNV